jgi:hypothetical protein
MLPSTLLVFVIKKIDVSGVLSVYINSGCRLDFQMLNRKIDVANGGFF